MEAINNANGDTDTTGGDCAAGRGPDTIDLAGAAGAHTPTAVNNFDLGSTGRPVVSLAITIEDSRQHDYLE